MVYTTYPKAAQTSGDNSSGFAKYVSGLNVLSRLWYASLSFHNTIFVVEFLFGVMVSVVVGDDEPPPSPSQSALLLVVGVEDDSNADLQLAKVASTDAVISSAVFLIFIFIAVLLCIN